MVALTREERRRRVLELHNQGKGTREIAQILQMSFRDIGEILKNEDRVKEEGQLQVQQQMLSSRAYEMYSAGKNPVQVAIELNIRAPEANMFLREYWELAGLHQLNQMYGEVKVNPWPLVNLYRCIRTACMGMSHVITLLKIANNDLPNVEQRYNFLKQEVESLQEQRRDLYNEVTLEGSNLEYYRVQSQREIIKFKALQERRKKAEAIVAQFENGNLEYLKIRKTVEEKVHSTLSSGKVLLGLALYCLIESIKENPEKYCPLINENRPPREALYDSYYGDFSYSQQQPTNYFDTKTMIVEETEKTYKVLAKNLINETLADYSVNISTHLPLLPICDETNA